jgi:hypothetical protein
MSLIDETPGGFITVANVVLYSTVAAETWMLTTDSMVAMFAVLALLVAVSAALVRFMFGLMGPEQHAAPAPVVAASTPAPRPRVAARPLPAVRRPRVSAHVS